MTEVKKTETKKVTKKVAPKAQAKPQAKAKLCATCKVKLTNNHQKFCQKCSAARRKAQNKIYYRHTGYPGGIYSASFAKLQARHPDRVLKLAVKGMLPKGPLGYAMIKKLKVYADGTHPHAAQQPKALEF